MKKADFLFEEILESADFLTRSSTVGLSTSQKSFKQLNQIRAPKQLLPKWNDNFNSMGGGVCSWMNKGHRRHLQDRLLNNGAAAFRDQERIKLLLTALFPTKDVERISTTLKAKFGGLRGVLDARMSELEVIDGIGAAGAMSLSIVREMASLYLQETAEHQESLGNSEALERFWRFRIGALPYEVFQVAFLNSAHRLLRDGVEEFARGVADRAVIYPRVVMEAALFKGAAAIVLAHNHTNGSVEPSEQDKALTRMIVLAGEALQLRVLDHLIVSADNVFSFRRAGLL